jgi:hypothetical protein
MRGQGLYPSATGKGQVADCCEHGTLNLRVPYKVGNFLTGWETAHEGVNLFHDRINTSETMTMHYQHAALSQVTQTVWYAGRLPSTSALSSILTDEFSSYIPLYDHIHLTQWDTLAAKSKEGHIQVNDIVSDVKHQEMSVCVCVCVWTSDESCNTVQL